MTSFITLSLPPRMAKQEFPKQIDIRNKRAGFEYHFIDEYTAGIVLMGTEVKAIRIGKANITEAYCYIKDGEMYIKNMHISEYDKGTHYNHTPLRERKLLLQKREINKLAKAIEQEGLTIIVKRLYINDKGLAKLDVALGKGKKLHDKRDDIKEKDIKRELARSKF